MISACEIDFCPQMADKSLMIKIHSSLIINKNFFYLYDGEIITAV